MITASDIWSIQEPILFFAAFIEAWLHATPRLRKRRTVTFEAWYNLQLIKWPDRAAISNKFSSIFQKIYGKHFFSWRRLIAGAISSFAAVSIVYYVIGFIVIYIFDEPNVFYTVKTFYSRSTPFFNFLQNLSGRIIMPGNYSLVSPKLWVAIIWDSVGYNVIPDLISLAETGWVIRLASNQRAKLIPFIALDLILTSLIWYIWLFTVSWLQTEGLSVREFNNSLCFHDNGFSMLIYFILSTYFTSMLWIGFVFTTLLIGYLRRSTNLIIKVIESRIVQELPILFFTTSACLFSWMVFFVVWAIRQAT